MIKIHGSTGSPYVRKVLAVLAIKNLPFEQIQQMPFARDAEFQKISPLGKIPVLQDADFTLADSRVICEYLEDTHPAPPVYPTNPADKAKARWLEEIGGTRATELASGIFFQRFMRPLAFKQDPDEVLVSKIIDKQLPPVLDYFESVVPEAGFIFGDFLLADLCLTTAFVNAGYAGYTVDVARWPKFSSFITRVHAHPAVAPLLAEEAAIFGAQ